MASARSADENVVDRKLNKLFQHRISPYFPPQHISFLPNVLLVFFSFHTQGMLIYVPPTARAGIAALICSIAIANLNYFRPHKNKVLFWLTQISFITTTSKYIIALLLKSLTASLPKDELYEDLELIGQLLIGLDVFFMASSVFAIVISLLMLRSKYVAINEEALKEQNGSKVLPRGNSRLPPLPVHQTTDLDLVEEIEKNHENHRTMALRNIKKQQSMRHNSVQLRVQARKKVKHSNVLLRSKYFSNLDPKSISKMIDTMDLVSIEDINHEICRQGDVADVFYIIISGTCNVTIDGNLVTVLGELDVFGEQALFQKDKGKALRSATVTTAKTGESGHIQLLALSKSKFDKLIASGTLNEECLKTLKRETARRISINKEKKEGVRELALEGVLPAPRLS